MLSRKYRLPSSIVLNSAKFIRGTYFNAKTQENKLDYERYGFVIAKSVDKRAVVRNRIRRVVRSVVEKEPESRFGRDVLFICKPTAAVAENIALREDLSMILEKIRQ